MVRDEPGRANDGAASVHSVLYHRRISIAAAQVARSSEVSRPGSGKLIDHQKSDYDRCHRACEQPVIADDSDVWIASEATMYLAGDLTEWSTKVLRDKHSHWWIIIYRYTGTDSTLPPCIPTPKYDLGQTQ